MVIDYPELDENDYEVFLIFFTLRVAAHVCKQQRHPGVDEVRPLPSRWFAASSEQGVDCYGFGFGSQVSCEPQNYSFIQFSSHKKKKNF